jgi:phage N-6-adenine-methyltransferase
MRSATIGRIWPAGVMSSVRADWATPRVLFEMLDREFHFSLDVCAAAETATCPEFFTEGALDRPWIGSDDGAVWCNPPYGRKLGDWVEKGARSARLLRVTVVMLLPARTDTSWFHDYCVTLGEVRFLRGRLNFDDLRPSRAPFPSMLVIFRPGVK